LIFLFEGQFNRCEILGRFFNLLCNQIVYRKLFQTTSVCFENKMKLLIFIKKSFHKANGLGSSDAIAFTRISRAQTHRFDCIFEEFNRFAD